MDKFLQPEEFNLDDIFKGKYMIPVYQRPNSWGIKQVKQLISDINEAYACSKLPGGSNADDSVLFVGTMFIKSEVNVRNEYTEYTVVDGQQRITTLTLLLMSLLNALYRLESEDDLLNEIRNYLWKKEDRKNSREKRVLELGNIDRDVMETLFDVLYAKKDIVEYASQKEAETDNEIELNLFRNFLEINDYVESLGGEKEICEFADFIKYNVKVISIKINTNMVKLFTIFESINSKGKPLDDIDLIKSYIFQNLEQDDYSEYLDKWGQLIRYTNDNLNDYFNIFIRANIVYYYNVIKLDNFRALSENSLKRYYECEQLSEVLKAFINDMLKQVKYYAMFSNISKLEGECASQRVISLFKMNQIAKYNHTQPFFFKLLTMRGSRISEDEFVNLVSYAFRFVLTYQTISSGESKNTIRVFADVQNELYKISTTYKDMTAVDDHTIENIYYTFNKIIYEAGISNSSLRDRIRSTMTYRKNKDVVRILLSYLLETNEDNQTDYLKLNAILQLGKSIHVDHILPQDPDEKNDGFKYFASGDFMMLKPGQDFTSDQSIERVPINDFKNAYLHRLGNLRLEWANDNIRKSNKLIKLEEFDELFNCYKCVTARETELIDKILDINLLISTDNYDYSPEAVRARRTIEVNKQNYEDVDYKLYHPISYTLIDENKKVGKYTYYQLLTDVFDILYSLERERLNEIAQERYSPVTSNTTYITSEKSELREAYALGSSVFIEKNLSPKYIMKFLFSVLGEIGLSEEDLVITLEEK